MIDFIYVFTKPLRFTREEKNFPKPTNNTNDGKEIQLSICNNLRVAWRFKMAVKKSLSFQ